MHHNSRDVKKVKKFCLRTKETWQLLRKVGGTWAGEAEFGGWAASRGKLRFMVIHLIQVLLKCFFSVILPCL